MNQGFWLALGLLLASCDPTFSLPSHEHRERLVGGTLDTGDPAVGILRARTSPTEGAYCTGTLIAPTVFLTAAHCTDFATPSIPFDVYFGSDFRQASASDWLPAIETHFNPRYNGNLPDQGHDCGVLILRDPVTTTPPIPYNRDPLSTSLRGHAVRLVGYGLNDGNAMTGLGVKRELTTTIVDVEPAVISVGDPTHTTCQGDSGGPMLSSETGTPTLIGVTSYGTQACTGAGFSTRVDLCAIWIDGFLPDTIPPTIALTAPHDGDTVPSGFQVDFDAQDNRGVASVDLYANEKLVGTVQAPPWSYRVAAGTLPAGPTRLKGVAKDGRANQAESAEITVTIKRLGDTPGDPGTPCTTDPQCTGGGFCATQDGAHFCSRTCSTALACPIGFSCVTTPQFTNQCVPPKPGDAGGCSVMAPAAGPDLSWWLILLLIGLRTRRSRS